MTGRGKLSNGKKRHKRMNTPARKEQNRVAQRIYRQRQKERREQQLQTRNVSPRYLEIRPQPVPDAEDQVNIDTAASHSDGSWNPSLHSNYDESTSSQSVAHRQPLAAEANQLDLDYWATMTSLDIDHVQMGLIDACVPSLGLLDSTLDAMADPIIPPTTFCEQGHLEDAMGLEEIGTMKSSDTRSLSKQTSVLPDAGNNSFVNYDMQAAQVADPYTNSIELSQVSLLRICVHNARWLGIDVAGMFGWDCMMLCSPFYRPGTTVKDDPMALLATVSSAYTPTHLRPTLAQILFPHHPILDLIPFPGLRARAITLAATSPQLFDPLELKKDIVSGGLVCWGTKKDPGGQPWDMRSWEAAPWFLRKWRLLIGMDGELWKQSMWWQNMRGELPEL